MGTLALLGGLTSFFISTWHLKSAPIVPVAVTGQVNPFFIRGVTVYLDDFDYAFELLFFKAMVVLAMLGCSLLGWAERARA